MIGKLLVTLDIRREVTSLYFEILRPAFFLSEIAAAV